ncbi:MAG: hypothetical protein U0531_11820 [Dehalococcoidia bacterium]
MIDTWDSVGLRGTGSHDVVVSDLVVPTARSLSFREPPRHDAPLYRMPVIALGGLALSVVTLGVARRAALGVQGAGRGEDALGLPCAAAQALPGADERWSGRGAAAVGAGARVRDARRSGGRGVRQRRARHGGAGRAAAGGGAGGVGGGEPWT